MSGKRTVKLFSHTFCCASVFIIVLLFLADHVLRVEGAVELLLGEDAVLEDNVIN